MLFSGFTRKYLTPDVMLAAGGKTHFYAKLDISNAFTKKFVILLSHGFNTPPLLSP